MTQQVYEGEVVDNDVMDFFDDIGDVDSLDDSDMWGSRYRLIQHNSFFNGFEFPLKHWAGSELEANYPVEDLEHENRCEAGFALTEINVAVLAKNPELWELGHPDGSKEYSAKYIDKSWRRRYYFLVYCREAGEDNPAVITISGHHGGNLAKALELGRQKNMGIISKITGGAAKLPGPLLWIKLSVSTKKKEVGSETKKKIRPIVAVTLDMEDIKEMNKVQKLEVLNDLYVGHEIRDIQLNGLSQEAGEWSKDQEASVKRLTAPAPTEALQLEAPKVEVLSDGQLYIPDLSAGSRQTWTEVAVSIPGLFDNSGRAVSAYNALMKKKGLVGKTNPNQWEAWRTELLKLWDDDQPRRQDAAVEAMF